MERIGLRYKFELAVCGLKDGTVNHTRVPPYARLQMLLGYKSDWKTLSWSHESKIQIATPAQVGYSGGFIHLARTQGNGSILELTELPACRTNKPPTRVRSLRYATSVVDALAVDGPKNLIVTCHLFRWDLLLL